MNCSSSSNLGKLIIFTVSQLSREGTRGSIDNLNMGNKYTGEIREKTSSPSSSSFP